MSNTNEPAQSGGLPSVPLQPVVRRFQCAEFLGNWFVVDTANNQEVVAMCAKETYARLIENRLSGGTWNCSCGAANYENRPSCFNCGTTRPYPPNDTLQGSPGAQRKEIP